MQIEIGDILRICDITVKYLCMWIYYSYSEDANIGDDGGKSMWSAKWQSFDSEVSWLVMRPFHGEWVEQI